MPIPLFFSLVCLIFAWILIRQERSDAAYWADNYRQARIDRDIAVYESTAAKHKLARYEHPCTISGDK